MDTYFVCTGGVRHLYCNKTVIGYTSHKATFAFHNVVRRHYSARWASLQFSYVKFFRHCVCKNFLKILYTKIFTSVSFLPSYSKYKRGPNMRSGTFLRHNVVAAVVIKYIF